MQRRRHGGDSGPRRPAVDAIIKAGERADARLLQFGDDAREIIGLDLDVTVDHHQRLILHVPDDVAQIGHLPAVAMQRGVEMALQVGVRSSLLNCGDDLERRVVRVERAADDLHLAWIILITEGE